VLPGRTVRSSNTADSHQREALHSYVCTGRSFRLPGRSFRLPGRSFRLPGRSFPVAGPFVPAAGQFVPAAGQFVPTAGPSLRLHGRSFRSSRGRHRPAGPIVRQLRSGCGIRTIGGVRAPTVAACTGATVSARAALASQSRAIYGPVRRGGCWPLGPVRVTFGHTPKSVPADAGRTCHTFSDEFRRPNGHPNPRYGALTRRH
jgi:hypothetical protein